MAVRSIPFPPLVDGFSVSVVLHIVESLDYGGVESRMERIGERRTQSRYDHQFCAISRGGHAEVQLRTLNAEVSVLGTVSHIPSVRAILALRRLLKALGPSVVHCHGAEANFHAVVAARLSGVRLVICEEIGIPDHSPMGRLVFRAVYGLCARIIAVSESTKVSIVSLREAKPSKIAVVDSPATIGPFLDQTFDGPTVKLVFVGRLEPVKNIFSMLQALSLLKNRGLHTELDIFGNGTLRDRIVHEVETLDLMESVRIQGYHSNPISGISGAQFFLQPSFSEGVSIALVEAMARGLVPLVSPVGGGPEVVEDGVSGWVFPGLDPSSVAETIEKVWTLGPVRLQAASRAASGAVSQRFHPDKYIGVLEDVYDSLH